MAELFAADAIGLELDRVSLAIKRPRALTSALPPAELPLAVLLAVQIYQPGAPVRTAATRRL